MQNLVRIVDTDEGKKVLWYREWFDNLRQLNEREPTRHALARDNAPVHDRLNDSPEEAERYFEKFAR